MRLLLDSHILLWAVKNELSKDALDVILDERNDLYLSVAAVWEIAIKLAKGTLNAPSDLLDRLPEFQIEVLPVTTEQAWAVQHLPLHHRDPFDRIMVVQAMREGLTLMTHDRKLTQYGCKLLLV